MSLDSCKTYPRTVPHLLSVAVPWSHVCILTCSSALPGRSGNHWLFSAWDGERGEVWFLFFFLFFSVERNRGKNQEKINICMCTWDGRENKVDASFGSYVCVCETEKACLQGVSQRFSSEEQSANPRLCSILTSQLYCLYLGSRMAAWLISSCRL